MKETSPKNLIMFNKVNKNLPYRSIRAIDDPKVISFLNQINKKTNLKNFGKQRNY